MEVVDEKDENCKSDLNLLYENNTALMTKFGEMFLDPDGLDAFYSRHNLDSSDTLLHLAIRRTVGNFDEINQLLYEGDDIHFVNSVGRSALHEAVMNPHCSLKLVKHLLDKEPSLIDQYDLSNRSALHLAIMYDNNEAVVEELLNRGANVNIEGSFTPWYIAPESEIVDEYFRRMALELDQLESSVDDNLEQTPLHCALMCPTPNEKVIRLLVARGADVNAVTTYHHSVLHYAVANKAVKWDIIHFLLDSGAKPDYRDTRDYPPLGYFKNYRIGKLLVTYSVVSNLNDTVNLRSVQPEDVLDLQCFWDNICYFTWCLARKKTVNECLSMMGDKISSDCTMFEYLSQNYILKDSNKRKSFKMIPDSVLMSCYKYPFNKDIILSVIQRKELLNRLLNMPLGTRTSIVGNRKPKVTTRSPIVNNQEAKVGKIYPTLNKPIVRNRKIKGCTRVFIVSSRKAKLLTRSPIVSNRKTKVDTRSHIVNKVFFNIDIVYHIAKYLPNADLISLILVYSHHEGRVYRPM